MNLRLRNVFTATLGVATLLLAMFVATGPAVAAKAVTVYGYAQCRSTNYGYPGGTTRGADKVKISFSTGGSVSVGTSGGHFHGTIGQGIPNHGTATVKITVTCAYHNLYFQAKSKTFTFKKRKPDWRNHITLPNVSF